MSARWNFADGQLWGNPLFDWDYMKQKWLPWDRQDWLSCKVYDMLRIDHFRGFASILPFLMEIPMQNGDTGSRDLHGSVPCSRAADWCTEHYGGRLGYMTESVKKLLQTVVSGIKLLQFAFDSRDGGGASYFPEDYPPNCVAYVGTHDNDTAVGWTTSAEPEDVKRAYDYLGVTDAADINWVMMRAIWNSGRI